MPNEPLAHSFAKPGSSFGPASVLRYKKIIILAFVLLLAALLIFGPKAAPPVAKEKPQPVQQIAAPAPQPRAIQPQLVNPQGTGNGGAPAEKSKIEQAQDDLKYRSLYGSNVVAQPIAAYSPKIDIEKGGHAQNTQNISTGSETDNLGAGTAGSQQKPRNPLDYDPHQPLYTLPESTVIETVLQNKLEGEMTGPVDCMVTTDVYAPNTHTVVIPQGARIIGESNKVSTLGQERLAVTFHRIIIPGPKLYSIPLDVQDLGLDQEGGVGLTGKVNSHYASIFGASLAIGLIGGLSQVGAYASSGNGNNNTIVYGLSNGFSQGMAQASALVLERFLNRMPTITVPVGSRVKILLAADLNIPEVPSAPSN